MITFIRTWAEGLIVAVIIAAILEMILPEGNNKKYIKMVIGVYILFVILSPIITKFSGGDISFEKVYEEYFNTQNTIVTSSSIKENNFSSIEMIYLENLKKDITQRLLSKGYTVDKLEVRADFSKEEEYGKIEKIEMIVNKKEEETKVENVNKVEIQISQNTIKTDSQEKTPKLKTEEKKEIINLLIDNYGITKDAISLMNS